MQAIMWGSAGADPFNSIPQVLPELVYPVFNYFKVKDSYLNVNSPRVSVKKDGVLLQLTTIHPEVSPGSRQYIILPVGDSAGHYKFEFMVAGMSPGMYDIIFEGEDPTPGGYGPLVVTGGFVVGWVTRLKELVYRLRDRLFDFDPTLYQLMDQKQVWTDNGLMLALQSAIDTINIFPVASRFTIETFPHPGLVIEGGYANALMSRSVLEVFNTMSYSDGHSLQIARSAELRGLAQQAEADFKQLAKSYKDWWSLYGDDNLDASGVGIGMGSQSIPLQISRILSWMPNMSNTFGI
jgi:hypothetical protein